LPERQPAASTSTTIYGEAWPSNVTNQRCCCIWYRFADVSMSEPSDLKPSLHSFSLADVTVPGVNEVIATQSDEARDHAAQHVRILSALQPHTSPPTVQYGRLLPGFRLLAAVGRLGHWKGAANPAAGRCPAGPQPIRYSHHARPALRGADVSRCCSVNLQTWKSCCSFIIHARQSPRCEC
jgi:hypothetical protein